MKKRKPLFRKFTFFQISGEIQLSLEITVLS